MSQTSIDPVTPQLIIFTIFLELAIATFVILVAHMVDFLVVVLIDTLDVFLGGCDRFQDEGIKCGREE